MTKTNDPNELDVRGRRKGQRGARKGTTTHPGRPDRGEDKAPGSIGQAPYVPDERDREFVRTKVWFIGQEATARRLGICSRTLQRHFKKEIADCEIDFEEALGKKAMQKAMSGDGPMLRFLLATRFKGRWSPKIKHEHTGEGGGPIREINLGPLIEGKTEDELADLEAILERLGASTGESGSEGYPERAPAGEGGETEA